jgi:hypothetical protein
MKSGPRSELRAEVSELAMLRVVAAQAYSDQPLIQKHRDSTIESCPVYVTLGTG